MNNKHLILSALLTLMLTSCGLVSNDNISFDNSNIVEVEGQEGYYVDDTLIFCAEIRGSYKANRSFTLDPSNENLRVWDNIYLYEYDYFQMIVNESPTIFYSVNQEDLEYVNIEDNFARATIKLDKSGIYKLTFDLSTKLFDLEFKEEIVTPVYETMSGCDIYSLKSEFTPLVPNNENSEELMIANYEIDAGAVISFHNHDDVHLSNYKVILDNSINGKYASAIESGDKHIKFTIGGKYNIYVNPVTYFVRVELTNPDEAIYSLQFLNLDETYTLLTAPNKDTPYLFKYQVSVDEKGRLPIYSSADYIMYDLTVITSEYIDSLRRLKVAGTYEVEINLKTFTISVNYLGQ